MFIKLDNVGKRFDQTQALQGITLELEAGEQYAICGTSGSGKSTLLYLLGGLDTPSEGSIFIEGKNLAVYTDDELADYRNSLVGFVFQFHFLLSSMTSLGNILLPAGIGGLSKRTVMTKIRKLAKDLGVEHCLNKRPDQLSGGEQQRVNIIRALSLSPKLLLCDEPTGNLDSKNSQKVSTLLRELALEYGATLIVVTHDKEISSRFKKQFLIQDGKLQ